MTVTMTRETLLTHYKAIRERLGDTRTPSRPIIPLDRIRPTVSDQPIGSDPSDQPIGSNQSDQPIGSDQLHPKFKPTSDGVIRQPSTVSDQPIPKPPKADARLSTRILYDVATRHNMTVQEMIGKDRRPRYTRARQEAMYLLRQAGYSYPQVGRFVGGRDHTTALHGERQHAARITGRA